MGSEIIYSKLGKAVVANPILANLIYGELIFLKDIISNT